MNSTCFENEKQYGLIMHIARKLLSEKIITDDEFIQIREKTAIDHNIKTTHLILEYTDN